MKILMLVYSMLNIMYGDFYQSILKDVDYITRSDRGLVRSLGQCSFLFK